ncbi:MAG TPA: circadian clock KaiB family protein [Chitinophagaceae bacterium]|nr:circadian clock KaiB family protein [Chitinophagaceae bacterium]
MPKKQELQSEPDKAGTSPYVLSLYVTGASPNSSRAITNLKAFLEKHLKNLYELQVVDLYQQPQMAKSVDIIALPMLMREFPFPQLKMIGDMSNYERLLKLLNPVRQNP